MLCAFPVAGLQLLGHLLVHDLLEHGLEAFADAALDLVVSQPLVFFLHRLNLLL